jgi:choline dehydrogenase-like flavoprotein
LRVKEFQPEITMGGSFFSAGHLAMVLSENWPENKAAMKYHHYMAAYYAAIISEGKGAVRPYPFGESSSFIWFRMTDGDLRNLRRGLAGLCEMLLAGGAVEVYPCVFGVGPVKTRPQAKQLIDCQFAGNALGLTTVHTFGTCLIGEREDLCLADSFGKVRGFDNLYITDASMLPGSPGACPQSSVMAIARRNTLHFRDNRK